MEFNPIYIDKFMQTVSPSGNKKGCILIQFPPGLSVNIPKLDELILNICNADPDSGWKIDIEFRHIS